MKQKQIKIYSIGRSNIKDEIITSENFEDNMVTLTESFLTLALERYKNVKDRRLAAYRRNNKSDASRYRGRSKR